MKQCEKKVIYYSNELEDEFSKAAITPQKIDGSYDYEGGMLRKIGRVFWYHMIAKPLAFIFLKLKFHHKIINKKCLKKSGGKGYFLYGNHTNAIADALIPTMISHPVGAYVIVHPNNVSMPVLGKITPSLGAIPLPDDVDAMKHFQTEIQQVIKQKRSITIYPEAHIWPYYTKIRNFKDNSFRFPVQCQAPVFCFTNTYQKRKHSKTPQIVTYVDGPFYPQPDLPARSQRELLHDKVITSMRTYCQNSNVELIEYRKRED